MRALIFAFFLLMAPLTQAAAGSPRIASTTANTADCFFNWAETTYPQYFAPSHQVSQTLDI